MENNFKIEDVVQIYLLKVNVRENKESNVNVPSKHKEFINKIMKKRPKLANKDNGAVQNYIIVHELELLDKKPLMWKTTQYRLKVE